VKKTSSRRYAKRPAGVSELLLAGDSAGRGLQPWPFSDELILQIPPAFSLPMEGLHSVILVTVLRLVQPFSRKICWIFEIYNGDSYSRGALLPKPMVNLYMANYSFMHRINKLVTATHSSILPLCTMKDVRLLIFELLTAIAPGGSRAIITADSVSPPSPRNLNASRRTRRPDEALRTSGPPGRSGACDPFFR